MYVQIYAYLYTHIIHIYRFMHLCARDQYICVHVYRYLYLFTRVSISYSMPSCRESRASAEPLAGRLPLETPGCGLLLLLKGLNQLGCC